jgi:hypothetical protein
MRAGDKNEAVQMLDLLLEFFADGARWTRGRYHDGLGRHCLIGALDYLRRKYHVPSDAAVAFLQEAMPRRTFGLIYFNDHRCRSFAELRSVILKARALALDDAERERAAAAVKRWLLAALEAERTTRVAASDDSSAYMLSPRAPGELALMDVEEARSRQAAMLGGILRPVQRQVGPRALGHGAA